MRIQAPALSTGNYNLSFFYRDHQTMLSGILSMTNILEKTFPTLKLKKVTQLQESTE